MRRLPGWRLPSSVLSMSIITCWSLRRAEAARGRLDCCSSVLQPGHAEGLCVTWLQSVSSNAHDIEARIYKMYPTSDVARRRAAQEERQFADIGLLDVAMQGGYLFMMGEHIGEAFDAARCQCGDWPGRDGIDANVLRSKLIGQVARGAFQRGFGDGHDVVFWENTLACHIGQADHAAAAALDHQWLGALCHCNQRIGADVKRVLEAFAAGIDEAAFQFGGRRERDAVDENIQAT